MITQVESGLTVDQYNALKDATSGASWSLTAHKYNLDFSEVGVDQGRDNDTPDFDAITYGSYIYRIIGNLLERYDTINEMWYQVTAYTGISNLIDTDTPNIVVDGSAMYIYAANSDGIHIINTTNNALSFSAWSTVVSDDSVNKIAAVNKDRIHYTQMNTDKNIFQLRVAKFSGSWSVEESDIYYTYPFSNFCAAELPDGGDMIVAATQVPGITTVKLVVNVPTKYIKQQGGIIGFKYKNNWWGDHYDIDVVDELTAYRFRDRIKLTQFSDRVALTCYSSDGTQLFPYTMYRIYTTTDGVYWSKGNALPLPNDVGSSGAKLCQFGDYVYAIERSRSYKSLMTLYLGYSPSVCQLLIPHRRINSLSLSEGDMMQGSLTLSNEDGWLDDDSIISPQCRTVLVMRMGYWVSGENFQVQTNMAEIDTYDMSHTLPRKMVKVTFRDFLSWMTDINSAERPYYWDSQLLAGDNFIDTTNDKYGGLRHLEPQKGSFTSENSVLNLTSNNEEGVGFSTFSLYLWNGITQSQFTLATVGNSEYGGVTFRGSDKDNFWTAFYSQADDKIRLTERSGGVGDIKVQTSTLSWASTPETPRWIQVEFRYAHIIVRYSTDGITWTNCIDYLMEIVEQTVAPDLTPLATGNKERGYVGFIGKGYAPPDVETWPDDPPPYDDPTPYPPEPPYYPPYDPNSSGVYVPGLYPPSTPPSLDLNTLGNPHRILTASENGDVWRGTAFNANTGAITWQLAFTIPHPIRYYKKDPKKPSRRWFITDYGLYVCQNIWATVPFCTLQATNASIFGLSNTPGNSMTMSEKRPNWIIMQNYINVYSISENLGYTWQCLNIDATGVSGTGITQAAAQDYMAGAFDVPYGSNGTVYSLAVRPDPSNINYDRYKSTDWGHNFVFQGTGGIPYANFAGGFPLSPYRRKSGIINKVDSHHEIYYYAGGSSQDGIGLALTNDAGATIYEDTGHIASPGLRELQNPAWYTSFTPNRGAQTMYLNPSTAKRKFIVISQHGSGNHTGVLYSIDNWQSYQFLPGFTYGFDVSFGNNSDRMHIVGFPTNYNFLICVQPISLTGAYDSLFKYTPNLGVNWFDITPPVTFVDYTESRWVAIDCE